ncbi:MAG: hypothetical protein MUC36_10050 [Planctomycetes bacterium]|jgi:hypothetical protein|nr:hypothetical protein [Planctomycetota bacterium]
MHLFRCLGLGLLATTTAAQTFVVDLAGGPGVDFTSIPSAVAAVPDGATLVVQPGIHLPFTIYDKSLTVLGGPGVVIGAPGVVEVRNLAAGRRVVLRGLEVRGIGLVPGVFRCSDNAGALLIEACRSPLTNGAGCRLECTNCQQVRIVDCTWNGGLAAPVVLYDSVVSMVRATCPALSGAPSTLQIAGGVTELVDCDVRSLPAPAPFGFPINVLSPGVVRLLGTTRIDNRPFQGWSGPAITGPATVLLDPTVLILASTPAFGATTTVISRAMPSLRAASAQLGSEQEAVLRGPLNGVGGLWAGLETDPLPTTVFGSPWYVDPAHVVAMAGGTFVAPLVGRYSVPPLPALLAARIAWQGWSFDLLNGFQISNAMLVAHW